jgi:hypothetical protein
MQQKPLSIPLIPASDGSYPEGCTHSGTTSFANGWFFFQSGGLALISVGILKLQVPRLLVQTSSLPNLERSAFKQRQEGQKEKRIEGQKKEKKKDKKDKKKIRKEPNKEKKGTKAVLILLV